MIQTGVAGEEEADIEDVTDESWDRDIERNLGSPST